MIYESSQRNFIAIEERRIDWLGIRINALTKQVAIPDKPVYIIG
jgi:hypothetical protein